MDVRTAREIRKLDNRFYDENAASFSATRSAPWEGWDRCLDAARSEGALRDGARVLDVACGNLRFESFLGARTPEARTECLAVDACAALADGAPRTFGRTTASFEEVDVLACLEAAGEDEDEGALALAQALSPDSAAAVDLAVCFGFFHHVPSGVWRRALLRALVACVRPGGVVCASFWKFMDDRRLARKAEQARERAEGDPRSRALLAAFEPGDAFLGWQDSASLRYCHHFSDGEVDALAKSVADAAEVVARFRADGKSGHLNEYLVIRKRRGPEGVSPRRFPANCAERTV